MEKNTIIPKSAISKISLAISLFWICLPGFSQTITPQVLSSGGGSVPVGGYQIDYTIGDLAIQTAGTNPIITEGFEQPELGEISLPVLGLKLQVTNENDYAHVYFSTVQEFKTDHFLVERSMDGLRFDSVSVIKTKALQGNSTTPLSYHYMDPQRIRSLTYYRIAQVDQNENMAYSSVVTVKAMTSLQNTLKIFPNPASNQIQVQTGHTSKKTQLRIYSMAGQLIFTREIPAGSTGEAVTVHLEGWSSGIYILEADTDGKIQRARFIKK